MPSRPELLRTASGRKASKLARGSATTPRVLLVTNLVFVVLAAIVMLRSVVVVPAGHAYVVERLGKYDRTLGPGIAVLVPFVEVVRFRHPTTERTLDLDSPIQTTEDNVVVRQTSMVRWRVTDPERASYAVADIADAVREAALTAIRSAITRTTLAAALGERAALERRVAKALGESCAPWGVEIAGCEIRSVELPADVVEEMKRAAERERASRTNS
jgi:regulator of protease activity HflC (stomatin/prohibitin superfamily)